MDPAASHPRSALPGRASLQRTDVPEAVKEAARRAELPLTRGLPTTTWNGMSEDCFEVGAKAGGSRTVHLLSPGLHPATPQEARERFAWNPPRQALWDELTRSASLLHQHYGVSHIAAGGSYFSTDYPTPQDMDLVAFTQGASFPAWGDRAHPFERFNRRQGAHGLHLYPHNASIFFPGGPSSLWGFRFAPPNPRPEKPRLDGPRGPEVGLVLLDLAAFSQLPPPRP